MGGRATPHVVCHVDSGVCHLTLANPARRNALTPDMASDLARHSARINADSSVLVVVLAGEPPGGFCSGADLGSLDRSDDLAAGIVAVAALRKPVIVALTGWCIGAGLELALAGDVRLASTTAKLSLPAAQIGVGVPLDLVDRLSALIGPGRAAELLYTGRAYCGDEAAAIGLINRTVPDEELDDTVLALARTIADNAPLTVQAIRYAIRRGTDDGGAARDLIAACTQSADFVEGVSARVARRPPRFAGH